jgi:hypothetical protein
LNDPWAENPALVEVENATIHTSPATIIIVLATVINDTVASIVSW